MNTNEIVDKLLKAKEAYYNSDTPIMTDSEFDNLEALLKNNDPQNMYFSIVGTNIKGSNKIKHDTPMLSCDKVKSIDGIIKWLNKINCNDSIVIMPKVDGLSGSIKYVHGELSRIVTRGDGLIGQDITYLKDYLNIPLKINSNEILEVRGEIYLPKNTEFNTHGKPLRNAASGLVNRKSDKDDCKYLKFIAYYGSFESDEFDTDLAILSDQKFITVGSFTIQPTVKKLEYLFQEYLTKWRNEWEYETDGLVLQVNDKRKYQSINASYEIRHHNYYNLALKPPSEGSETILRDITLDTSKQGNIIPVANFDPIFLGDREVKNATLNNYENIINNQLAIGDTIFITLANDVIPFFSHVVHHSDNPLFVIENCPSCKGELKPNGVHLQCVNPLCPDKNIKKILSYCVDCEMDGIAESTIRTLYNEGFIKTIVDLYNLHIHKYVLLNMDGFGESKINNLLKQIEKSKKQTIVQFVARLGIDNVGERAVENLNIKTLKDFISFDNSPYVNGKSIIKFKNENKEFIDTMLTIINPSDIVSTSSKGNVCITGSGPLSRKELIKILEEKGYTSVDSIAKETILVCEDINGDSSKLVKARKLGIKIMSYDEFFKE